MNTIIKNFKDTINRFNPFKNVMTYSMFLFSFLTNTMKSIFRPAPDMRYKLNLNDSIVSDKVSTKMIPLKANKFFNVHIHVDDIKIDIFHIDSHYCGLPIVSNGETKIEIFDILGDEIIGEYTFKHGEFIDYKLINDECDFLHLN